MQLLTFQDSPSFLVEFISLQSVVVVDGVVDGEEDTEASVVVERAVVLGIGVVGHGLDSVSILQDALQYAM